MSWAPNLDDKCADCEVEYKNAEAYEPMFDDNDNIIGWVCDICYCERIAYDN